MFLKSTEKKITANGMRYCLFYSSRTPKFNRSLGTAASCVHYSINIIRFQHSFTGKSADNWLMTFPAAPNCETAQWGNVLPLAEKNLVTASMPQEIPVPPSGLCWGEERFQTVTSLGRSRRYPAGENVSNLVWIWPLSLLRKQNGRTWTKCD